METLKGKIALVTGGSRGIGAAVALSLAGAGADVAVNFQARAEDAEKVCLAIRNLGRRALAIQADVSQSDQVKKMVAQIESKLGAVNIVVNNAGIARQLKLEDIAESDWEEHISVNLKSAFLVTQAVLPQMRAQRWGRIINISSTAAQTGGLVGPHYAASKAGMLGLTHSYAALLAKEGITANTVCLALVETDMARIEGRAFGCYGLPLGNAFGRLFWVGALWGMCSLTLLILALRAAHVFYFGAVALHAAQHFDGVGVVVAVASIDGSQFPVFWLGFVDGSDFFRSHSAPWKMPDSGARPADFSGVLNFASNY